MQPPPPNVIPGVMMYLLLAVVPHAGHQNVSADHRLEKDGGDHGHARHRKPDRPYAPVPQTLGRTV